MPGMGEENVKVSIDNNLLKISGDKTTSRKDKDKNYIPIGIQNAKLEDK